MGTNVRKWVKHVVSQNVGGYRKERIFEYFRRFTDAETCEIVFEELFGRQRQTGVTCPHCTSSHIVKNGLYRDRQRYKCKNCTRTFNDLTHTPLHGTHHPHKWIKYLECIIKGFSLRRSAIRVGISWVTLFYWRHKIIHVLELLSLQKNAEVRRSVVDPAPNMTDRTDKKSAVLAEMRELLDATPWGRQLNKLSEKYERLSSSSPVTTYFMLKYQRVFPGVRDSELELFAEWIRSFERIARKYWYRYVEWFRFLQRSRPKSDLDVIKSMLFTTCCIRFKQTYSSLRHPLQPINDRMQH